MWKCMFLSNKIYRGTLCTIFEKSTQKMLIEFYRRSKHKSVRIRNPFNLDFHFSEHKNKILLILLVKVLCEESWLRKWRNKNCIKYGSIIGHLFVLCEAYFTEGTRCRRIISMK